MSSKLCFLMTWFCIWQIKRTFMQCDMVKVIWTFWGMKLGLLLQFYCCQGIVKSHIENFIEKMHLTHTMKQSCVQWAEVHFERYYQTFIWLTRTHRLQKIDAKKYKYCLRSWIQFQTVWLIFQSQRSWKHYPLLWKTRHKTIY